MEFQFFAPSQHLYVMPGKNFRTRSQKDKKREIKTRFVQNLGSEPGLSNHGSASIPSCFSVPYVPESHSCLFWEWPYLKQGQAVWCPPEGETVQGSGSLCPRAGFVWRALPAHAEGTLTRLGSLRSPTVLATETQTPQAGTQMLLQRKK